MTFSQLGLCPAILSALAARGYAQPTPIQARAIPPALAGRDILGAAATGTGKTAAFVLPILQRLGEYAPSSAAPRALILAPTRELAGQVRQDAAAYAAGLSVRSLAIYGGVGIEPQIKALRQGVDLLVATPGRLLDHLARRTIDLGRIEHVVLDEADRMLDLGFLPALKRILAVLPRRRQTALYSATFPVEVHALANGLLSNPERIAIGASNRAATTVEQRMFRVADGAKTMRLLELLAMSPGPTLIFTRTKRGADRLARKLQHEGRQAMAIHGDKSQAARQRALLGFRTGELPILVATDLAARGIDIAELPLVINHDLPDVAADYVHRIGRTGRAGSRGRAWSLLTRDDQARLRAIEALVGCAIPVEGCFGAERAAPLPQPPTTPRGAPMARAPAAGAQHTRARTARGQNERRQRPGTPARQRT